jgi:hypothetical protein
MRTVETPLKRISPDRYDRNGPDTNKTRSSLDDQARLDRYERGDFGEAEVKTISAPAQAELQRALLEIGHAAQILKGYDRELVDLLQIAIRTHSAAFHCAEGLSAQERTLCDRIASQGKAVMECIERARNYPAYIVARADLLDRAGILARTIRDLQTKIGTPPAS